RLQLLREPLLQHGGLRRGEAQGGERHARGDALVRLRARLDARRLERQCARRPVAVRARCGRHLAPPDPPSALVSRPGATSFYSVPLRIDVTGAGRRAIAVPPGGERRAPALLAGCTREGRIMRTYLRVATTTVALGLVEPASETFGQANILVN